MLKKTSRVLESLLGIAFAILCIALIVPSRQTATSVYPPGQGQLEATASQQIVAQTERLGMNETAPRIAKAVNGISGMDYLTGAVRDADAAKRIAPFCRQSAAMTLMAIYARKNGWPIAASIRALDRVTPSVQHLPASMAQDLFNQVYAEKDLPQNDLEHLAFGLFWDCIEDNLEPSRATDAPPTR
jgi:hypothetical protein